MSMVTFKATSRLTGTGLAVQNDVRQFSVIMDEPEELGGTDLGMNPVEMMLAALGSCQCIVAKAFARANRIEFEDFWVELEGDLDTDGFLKGKPGVRNGFQEVRVTTHIKTDATPEKVEAFRQFIQSRCPVGDVMLNGVSIVPGDLIIEKSEPVLETAA